MTSHFFSMVYDSILCSITLVHKPSQIYPVGATSQAQTEHKQPELEPRGLAAWPPQTVMVTKPQWDQKWRPGARIPPNGWEVTKGRGIQQ